MKDTLNAISQFPILQFFGGLTILALGIFAWVKANKDNKKSAAAVDDGNRPATLYDLSQLRQSIQIALSERTGKIYERIDDADRRGQGRLDDHESRISALEGARSQPRRR
jgi:hypothetical protein